MYSRLSIKRLVLSSAGTPRVRTCGAARASPRQPEVASLLTPSGRALRLAPASLSPRKRAYLASTPWTSTPGPQCLTDWQIWIGSFPPSQYFAYPTHDGRTEPPSRRSTVPGWTEPAFPVWTWTSPAALRSTYAPSNCRLFVLRTSPQRDSPEVKG